MDEVRELVNMTLMVAGLYAALKDAGAQEALAKQAAEEVANFKALAHDLKSDMKLLKWMLGFNIAISMAILFHLFS